MARSPRPVGYSLASEPTSLAIADVDGDGKPDLEVDLGAEIAMLSNDGHGTFGLVQSYPTTISSSSLAVADIDGDGALDLIAGGATSNDIGAVAILLGSGSSGGFGSAAVYLTVHESLTSAAGGIAVADLDGDGKPDIIHSQSSPTVSVLLGNGDGTLQPDREFYGASGVGGLTVAPLVSGATQPYLWTTNEQSSGLSILAPSCIP